MIRIINVSTISCKTAEFYNNLPKWIVPKINYKWQTEVKILWLATLLRKAGRAAKTTNIWHCHLHYINDCFSPLHFGHDNVEEFRLTLRIYSEDVKIIRALILDPWILHTDHNVGTVAVIRLVSLATLHITRLPSVFRSLEKSVRKPPNPKN